MPGLKTSSLDAISRDLLEKGIGLALGSNSGGRSMSRQDYDIIPQWKQLLPDASKEQIGIAPRQIPAANAAGEKNIAPNQERVRPRQKAEAPRTMPRHLQDLHLQTDKIARWRFLDQEVGFGSFDFKFKAKITEEFGIGNHRRRFRMTTQGTPKALFDSANILNMINMAVSEQEQLKVDFLAFEPLAGSIGGVE